MAGPDACTLSAGTRTCTGDQSDGISESTVSHLEVRNLTGDIAPASAGGIRIARSYQSVSLNSDTGSHAVRTQGSFAPGISANSGLAGATIVHSGDIETTGFNAPGVVSSSGAYYNFQTVRIDINGGRIVTRGDRSTGIFGSAGRYSVVTISNDADIETLGTFASGIQGSAGNSVFVTNHGDILTSGEYASAIGAGSNYEAVAISNTGRIETHGNGSAGLAGGGYNSITITNSGDVETFGNRAGGLLASAFTYSGRILNTGAVTTHGDDARGLSANSHYGSAQVDTSAAITTEGDRSGAILATSSYGSVAVTAAAPIVTSGDSAPGITVSSGGQYGDVRVNLTGPLSTRGAGSTGISAYTYASNIRLLVSGDDGGIVTQGENAAGISARTAGWAYGEIDIVAERDIVTSGDGSAAIVASTYNDAVAVDLSARIVTSGDLARGIDVQTRYGSLNARISGSIETAGLQSHGIAMSGTGYSGTHVEVGSGGAIRTHGNGASAIRAYHAYGALRVINQGEIATLGQSADAIDATLAAGPGAYGSRLDVTNEGSIVAGGSDATAIRLASPEGGDVVNSGDILGGSGSGAAIRVSGGGNLVLDNSGTLSALSGLALDLSDGDDTIDNSGTLSGDVLLGLGTNRFNNLAGGRFTSGSRLEMGPSGRFENAGLFQIAGAGTIGTTAMTGNFVQLAGGTTVFDLDLVSGTADRLDIDGTAQIGGLVRLNLVTAPPDSTDSRIYDPIALITTTGGITADGPSLDPGHIDVNDTVAYDFELSFGADTLWLEVVKAITRFEPLVAGKASANQLATALYLDRFTEGGGGAALAPLFNALRMEADVPALLGKLDRLVTPTPLVLAQLGDRSMRRLLDQPACDAPDKGKVCLFVSGGYEDGDGAVRETRQHFAARNWRMTGGASLGLGGEWSVTAALSGGDTRFSAPWLTRGDADMLAGLLRIDGRLGKLGLRVTGVVQNIDAETGRLAAQTGQSPIAAAPRLRSRGIEARFDYAVELGGARLTPSLSASYLCHEGKGFAEQSGAAEAMRVAKWQRCDTGLTPGLALRVPLGSAPDKVWFDLAGSGQVLKARALAFDSALVAAGGLGGAMRSRYGFDNRFWTLSGGIGARPAPGMTLRATADLRHGKGYEDWSAGLAFMLDL